MHYLGIDPGWKNLGVVLMDQDGKILLSKTVDCSGFATLAEAVDDAIPAGIPIRGAFMERYVTYGRGTPNKDTESTQKVIGALEYALQKRGVKVDLWRAIDWKTILCKHLVVTKGFSNPSKTMDKKFSSAAAKAASGASAVNSHEADATCLCYMAWRKYGNETVL
jgi:hypothetical protein